jgi:hypothetical protein
MGDWLVDKRQGGRMLISPIFEEDLEEKSRTAAAIRSISF